MIPAIANLGSPTHWFILFVLILIVFGARRLPEIARNLGKGLVEFKKAKREFENELMKDEQPKPSENEPDKKN